MPGTEASPQSACVGINHGCWNFEALWVRRGEPLKLIAKRCVDVHLSFPGEKKIPFITFHKSLSIDQDRMVKLFWEAGEVVAEVTGSSS